MESTESYGTNGIDAHGREAELMCAVEALVFASEEPVTAAEIADVFAHVTQEDRPSADAIEQTVDRLNAAYAAEGRVLRVRRWAGGYRLSTTEAVAPYLRTYFRDERRRKLSRSLMETLAILAYKQPATKPEIDFVRGVDSDYALRRLLDFGLIDVSGRADSVGRPLLYGTTPRFLEEFGLDSLDELPNLRELEALLDDPAFNREKARLLMLGGLDAPEPSEEAPPRETSSEDET